mmetsp:Transcript_5850/g.20656  ORF Transcript_5850/g.20656 Transcript_5850/m.20656 type:complete len:88 (-) Transcript_5850:1667-1930(-)
MGRQEKGSEQAHEQGQGQGQGQEGELEGRRRRLSDLQTSVRSILAVQAAGASNSPSSSVLVEQNRASAAHSQSQDVPALPPRRVREV